MTLGEKLQTLRRQAGISQEDLAERLGVSRQAISKWELDKTVPEVRYIVALSGLFHVSTDALLKEGEPLPPEEAPREQAPPKAPPSVPHGDRTRPPGAPPDGAARLLLRHPVLTACRVMEVGDTLAATLLGFYLWGSLFSFSRPGLWPLAMILMLEPVLLVLSRGLLEGGAAPAAALPLGYGEVIDDLLLGQAAGAAGVPLLLGMTLPLLGALCLLGRLLAARLVRNIKRT